MKICRLALIGAACLLAASRANADELEGRWPSGSWSDTNSGHKGPLRGYFTPTCDGNYSAVFTGRYAKIMPFRFKTTLNVVGREGDKTYLAGDGAIREDARMQSRMQRLHPPAEHLREARDVLDREMGDPCGTEHR